MRAVKSPPFTSLRTRRSVSGSKASTSVSVCAGTVPLTDPGRSWWRAVRRSPKAAIFCARVTGDPVVVTSADQPPSIRRSDAPPGPSGADSRSTRERARALHVPALEHRIGRGRVGPRGRDRRPPNGSTPKQDRTSRATEPEGEGFEPSNELTPGFRDRPVPTLSRSGSGFAGLSAAGSLH